MKKRSGISFVTDTAVGLLVFSLILGIGAVAFPAMLNSGRYTSAQGTCHDYAAKISMYHFQTGSYPNALSDLTTAKNGYGPWILPQNFKAQDPWGTSFYYGKTATAFAVWSAGKNKANNSGSGVPATFGGDDVGAAGQ